MLEKCSFFSIIILRIGFFNLFKKYENFQHRIQKLKKNKNKKKDFSSPSFHLILPSLSPPLSISS